MCPRSFRDYITPPQEEEAEDEFVEPATFCLKTTAFVHNDTRAAFCVLCYCKLSPADKSSFCTKLRHTLSIGNIIDEVACSSCSRKITYINALSDCFACQRKYLYYTHGVGNYPTNTDGCIIVTIRDDTYQSTEDIVEFL